MRVIETFDFQETATDTLSDILAKALEGHAPQGADYASALLQAPTASGKTVMTMTVIKKLLSRDDSRQPQKYLIVCVGPDKLPRQTYEEFVAFGMGDDLHLVHGPDVLNEPNGFHRSTFLALEYALFNQERNLPVQGDALKTIIQRSKDNGLKVVLVVDEAHVEMEGPQNKRALNTIIQPDVRLCITATPPTDAVKLSSMVTSPSMHVTVPREDVVAAGLIVKRTLLNQDEAAVRRQFYDAALRLSPDVRARLHAMNEKHENRALHIFAAAMRLQQSQALLDSEERLPGDSPHRTLAMGIAVLDNRNAAKDGAFGKSLKAAEERDNSFVNESLDDTLFVLKAMFGWTPENGEVDIYMAGTKTIENPRDFLSRTSKVVVFKHALSTGFNAPRLHCLAILRDPKVRSCVAQILGRIARMLDRRHYAHDDLNNAYVYSAAELFEKVLKDPDSGLMTANTFPVATRFTALADRAAQIPLTSYYSQRNNQGGIKNAQDGYDIIMNGIASVLNVDRASLGAVTEHDLFDRLGFLERFRTKTLSKSGVLATDDPQNNHLADTEVTATEHDHRTMFDALAAEAIRTTVGAVRRSLPALRAAVTLLARDLAREADEREWTQSLLFALFGAPDGDHVSRMPEGSQNQRLFVRILRAGVESTGFVRAADFRPKQVEGGYRVPSHIKVTGPADNTDVLSLHAARPTNFASEAERQFPSLMRSVCDAGARVSAFFKNGDDGIEALGHLYDEGRAVAHPDWVVLCEVGDILHVVLVETKSFAHGRPDRMDVGLKAAGMQSWLEEQNLPDDVRLHAVFLNMHGVESGDISEHRGRIVFGEHEGKSFMEFLRDVGIAE